MPRRRSKLLLPQRAAWAAVLFVLAAACGDPGDVPRGSEASISADESRVTEVVAASGTHLLEEGSARVSMTMSATMPAAAGGGLMAGKGTGAYDYESNSGYFDMSFSMSSAPALGSMTMKTIIDFPNLYMNMTDMLRTLGGDVPGLKPWVHMNFNTIGEQVGIDLGALTQFGQSDAGQYALYTKGVTEVEKEGTETVRGDPATRYSATLDFEKLMEQDIPNNVRSSLEAAVELTGVTEVPIDVWLDEQDRMVRQRLDVPIPAGISGETTPMTIDMTYYGFGQPVDLDLPPERKTMEFEELLDLASGAGSPEEKTDTDAT